MNQFMASNECEELTHSQQQPQALKVSQKGVDSQVDYQNHFALPPPPPPRLSYKGLWNQLKSSARQHNQQQTLS